jgi:hypothetical protein
MATLRKTSNGRDRSRGARFAWRSAKFGTRRLLDVTPIDIRHALDDYADGYALRGDGIGSLVWQFAIRKGRCRARRSAFRWRARCRRAGAGAEGKLRHSRKGAS